MATNQRRPPSSRPDGAERELSLPSKDGIALHGELYQHPSPRGAALILHGYAEHCGATARWPTSFTSGFAALRSTCGHGRAAGARGHALRFDEFLGDVEARSPSSIAGPRRAAAGARLPQPRRAGRHAAAGRSLALPEADPLRRHVVAVPAPADEGVAVKRVGARWCRLPAPNLSFAQRHPDRQAHPRRRQARRAPGRYALPRRRRRRWFNEAIGAQAWVQESPTGYGCRPCAHRRRRFHRGPSAARRSQSG